ncbi:hypothetical protein K6U37_03395 [Vibrio parahaemolyticus]|uniref:hypothetical protein n=1 Tax=Vibrio parahaemolyticus TaxID=670 RepID=UPI001EECC892|nr:hypothetical protein [Vibrio parahaemolyticus]MCG6463759.1 hypothetical protein [Vibrio parahaemolyticus]MCG6487995.1 hypothetical protein [Vibrio parahaemolyticus]
MEFYELRKVNVSAEFSEAKQIATDLLEYLSSSDIADKIKNAHQFNAKSHDIQDIFLPKCLELGMTSEKKGLFVDQTVTRLRPDYYKEIGKTGLIMEVERGKTTANNMDLLDIWKCHLCKKANYLLLVVPVYRESANGSRQKIFEHVVKRLSTFFEPENYVNVEAAFIIGYE